jgi:hypothetical protein
MNQEIKNKIENLVGNQNIDERELLASLKQIVYESELQNSVARESKSIADLVSEEHTSVTSRNASGQCNQNGLHRV